MVPFPICSDSFSVGKRFHMHSFKILAVMAAITTVGLSGCAPILVGGAAITSATVMTDRRSTGSIVDDEVLEKRVR